MDSDTPLKVAFRVRTRDLLPLTDDTGAEVLAALAVESSAGGEEYLRHVEFQSRHRSDLALRCFEYTAVLAVRCRRPVFTTVMYLRPPAPRELVYRHALGGKVVDEWRFGVVRLWEQSRKRLLALGPGGAALIAAASRRIQRDAPVGQRPDLLAILQAFAEGRYTARQLAQVIPEEVAMASAPVGRAAGHPEPRSIASRSGPGLSSTCGP